jgi:single-strand DNA-binding protein
MPSSITTISGFLFKEPESRRTQGGLAVLSFSLPDNNGYGEKKTTQWIKCSLFGRRAESIGKFLAKGTAVQCSGHVEAKTYVGRDAQTKVSLDMSVDAFDVLHAPKQAVDTDALSAAPNQLGGQPDDEIPF